MSETQHIEMPSALEAKLRSHVEHIYPDEDAKALARQIGAAFYEASSVRRRSRIPGNTLWSQQDAIVITYADTMIDGEHVPLDLLNDFLLRRLKGNITGVHILPFFPWTSDDGFAITNYYAVDSRFGDWHHVNRIAGEFKLMADLVLNHCSSQGPWFSSYRQGQEPYDKYFFEASPEDDLSAVVRPRTSPLLREVETVNGTKYVWCTFSHDQVDLNFANPDVLLEFLRIMRFHIDHGVRTIRLDAVAFVWKEIGTSCIHLPQTHEIVRMMRTLCDFATEPVILITETNVPNHENLSYFGNRNEAHAIYNFPLPPLVVHAMLAGSARHLNTWQMAMPPAQMGCAYL
ncbi:MAG: alpha-amylase, partial [Salaquimonas sp.]|nr:alpha-amylase [Salaquimonas sp.]